MRRFSLLRLGAVSILLCLTSCTEVIDPPFYGWYHSIQCQFVNGMQEKVVVVPKFEQNDRCWYGGSEQLPIEQFDVRIVLEPAQDSTIVYWSYDFTESSPNRMIKSLDVTNLDGMSIPLENDFQDSLSWVYDCIEHRWTYTIRQAEAE